LHESENLYHKVFSQMNQACGLCEMVHNPQGAPSDYRFLEVNQAYTELTGVSLGTGSEQTIGQALPGVKDDWIKHFHGVIESGKPARFQSHDTASDRWFEVFVYKIGPGRLAHLLVEISDAKRNEIVLRRQEQRLLELNQELEQRIVETTALAEQHTFELRQLIEELGQTEQQYRASLSQILHDHLQLLVAAKFRIQALQLVKSPSDLAGEVPLLEGLINEAIEQARSVVAGLSPPILRDRGLVAGLEWLARRLREEHGLKVGLAVHPESEPEGEETKMFLFLAARELLLNVVKHSGASRASLGLAPADSGFLKLTVKDEGVGFARDKVEIRSHGGFGLFNIQQRLELLGGALDIKSSPGEGCEVSMIIPVPSRPQPAPRTLAPRDQNRDLPLERDKKSENQQAIRVMIVDDHEILREGLANLLESNSQIKVVGGAADGAVAVELALRLVPDVILMDVTMPIMNGIEATRCIKADLPECRIIALSMHEREDMEAAMREAGATAYVSKDVPWDQLNAVIQSLVIEKG